MRSVISGLLLLFTLPAAGAPVWQWHEPCAVDAGLVQCDVWFNALEPIDAITVAVGDRAQEVRVQPYGNLRTSTIGVLLLNLPGLTRSERREVRAGLEAYIQAARPYQSLGLFASGAEGLRAIGFPGTAEDEQKSTLIRGLSAWRAVDDPRDPLADLHQVIEILGGNPSERKAVYWLTFSLRLSPDQISDIGRAAEDQRVRLVVLHLVRSELEINSFPGLRALGDTPNGFYQFRKPDRWAESIPELGVHAGNGARITFAAGDLCGSVPVSFGAALDGESVAQSEEIAFPPCFGEQPTDGEVTVEGEPAVEDESQPESESQRETDPPPETDAEANESAGEAAEPTGAPITGGEEVIESGEELPAESAEETAEEGPDTAGVPEPVIDHSEPAAAEEDQGLQVALLGLLGVLIVVVIAVLLLRGRKAGNRVESPTQEAHGYLDFVAEGEHQRVPVDKHSVSIGRSEDSDVVLSDDTVSASHAAVKLERSGNVLLVDLNSSNGTYVNGEEIEQRVLASGDRLQFGDFQVTYTKG